MPSFFGSKSRPQRDSNASTSKAGSTPAPAPPPKDGMYDYDYDYDYGASSEAASNLYQGGVRITYAHKQPTKGGSRTRRTSTPAYTTSGSQSAQSAQSLPSRRPLSSYASYTAQPRRPSPLTGPPIVAPPSSHLRAERPTIQRPHSDIVVSSSSSSATRIDVSASAGSGAPRPEGMQRSVSVVGDDWTRAYASVEYELDLDAELDRELDRRFKRPSSGPSANSHLPLRVDEYREDQNADGGVAENEKDAMLPSEEARNAAGHTHTSLGGGGGGTQTIGIGTTQTRHARTPSAGWRAWSGDYDDVDVVESTGMTERAEGSGAEAQALLSPASSSPPPSHSLSPASASASAPPVSISAPVSIVVSPAPAAASPSSASPGPYRLPSLHSSHSTPSLHSTSTSSHSRTSMASHKMNAPLPPLPSPVRSPMLDKARSRSHEPVITVAGSLAASSPSSSPLSVPLPPPTPPKQNDGLSMLAGHGNGNVTRSASVPPPAHDTTADRASAHARAATATDESATASMLPQSGVAQAPMAPPQVVDVASHTDASMRLQQPRELVASPSPSLTGSPQTNTQPTPEIQGVTEAERPGPPFLVLSSKAPPPSVVVPFPSPPLGSPPIASSPIASSPPMLPSIASQTLPASSSSANANTRTKTNIIPPGGAPELRNPVPFSQPAARPASLPAGLPPALPSLPSFTSFTPSSLSSSTPPNSNMIPPHRDSPGHPPYAPYQHQHPRQPTSSRASMILYHVTLPSSRASPLAHEFSHEYRSFGTLGPGTHPRIAGGVAEDGMLLPPVPGLSASASASSSSFNLLSSFFTHGHSQSRSGSPSASASNLHSASASGSTAPPPQTFTSPPPPPPLPSPPANRYSTYSAYSTSRESIAAPSYTSTTRGIGGGGSALVLASEDRDSKYNVGLMIGTIKSSGTGTGGYSTLPRVGTPLAASFGLADLAVNGVDEKQKDGTHVVGETGSIRGEFNDLNGSVRGGGLVAYAYDPDEDDSDDELGVEGDWLHDPDVWPYADGKGDVHARKGDWSWWRRSAKAQKPLVRHNDKGGRRGEGDGEVQMQMLESGAGTVSRPGTGSTTMSMSMSVGSRASIMKAPLPSPTGSHPPPSHPHPSHLHSHPHSHPHSPSYLPPYQPPSTLDTLLGRGAASAFTLVLVVGALMVLFIVYPVVQVYGDGGATAKILGNTAINATGQAVVD